MIEQNDNVFQVNKHIIMHSLEGWIAQANQTVFRKKVFIHCF